MLAGKVGILYRWGGWIRICSGLGVACSAWAVAIAQHDYTSLAVAAVGLPQIVLGWLYQRGIRGRMEQAHRLNA